MSNDLSKKQKRGTPLNPSEGGSNSVNPKRGNQPKEEPKEGEYRNVETSVNNPSSFGDAYAAEQEKEISREEARTENENDVPGKRRADQS